MKKRKLPSIHSGEDIYWEREANKRQLTLHLAPPLTHQEVWE